MDAELSQTDWFGPPPPAAVDPAPTPTGGVRGPKPVVSRTRRRRIVLYDRTPERVQSRFVKFTHSEEGAQVFDGFKTFALNWTLSLLADVAAGVADWDAFLAEKDRAFDKAVRACFPNWQFRSRLIVEWCATASGPFALLARQTRQRARAVLARRATRQRVLGAVLPVCPAVAVADFLCGDARVIEVRVFAEHVLLGSFLHRKLAEALGLLGARVMPFCAALSAFAEGYVADRPRVDFDGILAKDKTTLSKRACRRILRCDARHRY